MVKNFLIEKKSSKIFSPQNKVKEKYFIKKKLHPLRKNGIKGRILKFFLRLRTSFKIKRNDQVFFSKKKRTGFVISFHSKSSH